MRACPWVTSYAERVSEMCLHSLHGTGQTWGGLARIATLRLYFLVADQAINSVILQDEGKI